MTNALDIVITEAQRAVDSIPDAMDGLSPDLAVKLDYAVHKARVRIWKAEGLARKDWYANTRFATDPFVRRMAYIHTSGFFVILAVAWIFGIPEKGHDLMVGMIGALITTQAGITSYCFGASNTDLRKDTMLYHSTPTKQGEP